MVMILGDLLKGGGVAFQRLEMINKWSVYGVRNGLYFGEICQLNSLEYYVNCDVERASLKS